MANKEDLLRGILSSNAVYAAAFAQSDPALLKKLAVGQSPRILWLGCSDSRVSAELATGVAPGSIFVHRNVASCFHESDLSASAAMAYAVHVLKVEAIIVCGHTGCGGVKAGMEAAVDEKANGPREATSHEGKIIGDWIAPIKSMALEHLSPSENGHTHSSACGHGATGGAVDPADPLSNASLLALTDAHISQMVKNIADSTIVKDAWASGQQLSVHGWCYHVATAKLRDLDIGWCGVGKPAVSLGSAAGSEYDTLEEA